MLGAQFTARKWGFGMSGCAQDIDDATLLRFLRARSMDVTKGSKLFADHQKWRREYFPLGHAQEEEIKDEIAGQKYFIQGHDKNGRPLSVFLGAKHLATGSKNLEQYKRECSVSAFATFFLCHHDSLTLCCLIVDVITFLIRHTPHSEFLICKN